MKLKLGVQILKALVDAQALKANVAAAVLKAAAAAGKFIFRVPAADTVTTSEYDTIAFIKDAQDLVATSERVVNEIGKLRLDQVEIVELVALEAVKAITDSVATSDYLWPFDIAKGLQEIAATAETYLSAFTSAQSDTIAVADAIVSEFAKALEDTTTLSETQAIAFAKAVQDIAASADQITTTFTKILEDTADATDEFNLSAYADDGQTMAFVKIIDELVYTSETFDRVFTAFREFAETVLSSEEVILGHDKPLEDSVVISDTATVAQDKPQYDTVSSVDAVIHELLKALSDTISTSETQTMAISLLKDDAASTIDSGSIFYLNYCDPTYFAEQYVGQTSTF